MAQYLVYKSDGWCCRLHLVKMFILCIAISLTFIIAASAGLGNGWEKYGDILRISRFVSSQAIETREVHSVVAKLNRSFYDTSQNVQSQSDSLQLNSTDRAVPVKRSETDLGGKELKYRSKCPRTSANKSFNLAETIAKRLPHISGNHSFMSKCLRGLNSSCRDYFMPRKERVAAFNYGFVLANEQQCKKDIEMVIMVNSAHYHFGNRLAIRETWGAAVTQGFWLSISGERIPLKLNASLVFLLGLSDNATASNMVHQENSKYHDIVQGNFLDTYQNMTLKSLMGLKWVVEHCACVKHILKSDDDMFINFPSLLNTIRKAGDLTWSILGPSIFTGHAQRGGKWMIGTKSYPFSKYPTYESGASYVMDISIVRPLFELSEYVPHIWIDDAYITGILARILGIRHVPNRGFAQAQHPQITPCAAYQGRVITGSKATPELLWRIWTELTHGNVC